MKVQEEIDLRTLKEKLVEFPAYINNYVVAKLPHLSPSSLLEYVRDFNLFLSWLLQEGLSNATCIKDIAIEDLDNITINDINKYMQYLITEREHSKLTVSRKMNTLRILYNFLHEEAEDRHAQPLLKRNIMRKITIKRPSDAKKYAKNIQQKVLTQKEIHGFVDYLKNDYIDDVSNNPQALYNFKLNRIRDICIISLVLNSGLRVSDIVNMNIDDISLEEQLVYIISGQHERYVVNIGKNAQTDIEAYLKNRNKLYTPLKHEKAMFLSMPNGTNTGKRITKRAVQEMVKKYARYFGKEDLTVRHLRHSFGVQHYDENNLIKTKSQLGQRSIEATEIYGHLAEWFKK